MPRQRSPNRDKAFKIWKDSGGSAKLKDIAEQLGVKDTQIRKWKNQDGWDEQLKGNVTKRKRNVTNKSGAPKGNSNAKGHGAPKGNQNAVGNSGGGPPRNDKAVTHGLFRKFLPQDEDYLEVYDAAGETSSLDMLWAQIQIKFANIIHAQKVMFVTDIHDETKVLKKRKESDTALEVEWEYQHAWDKQATALNAQARAMGQLTSMIRQYEEMCRLGWADEERQMRVQELKAKVTKLQAETDNLHNNDDEEGDGLKSLAQAIHKSVKMLKEGE